MVKDLIHAVRMLRQSKGWTVVVLLSLALGIGANTAIFSVVNAFLLRPLPYGDPDRLVMVDSQQQGQSTGVSLADYVDWRRRNNVCLW